MKLEIVKLRKKIFKNLKKKAMSYEEYNSDLAMYLDDQEEYSKRNFSISNIEELIESVQNSQAVFLGDFHTFDQNIRNVLRIIKVLIAQDSNCILALEMVSSEYQLYIDTYIEGHLTDLEFLESIDYNESWRFPWSHYKLIFELAKEHEIKVIGINTSGSLAHRDQFAAEKLQEIHLDNPDSKILTLYGELHITKDKIPSLLRSICPQLKQAIIHQNLDEVYWKLIKKDREQGIIAFSQNEFCIISAPPWIKYESMIYWYENLCDDPDFDIHSYIIENGKKIFSDDTKENFLHICHELADHLKLETSKLDLEDFNLYDHTNLENIENKINKLKSQKHQDFYHDLLLNSYSFSLNKAKVYYCSNYSMNRISYIAGIHFYNTFSIKKTKFDEQDPQAFFINSCFEAIFAYFFSKIINPHRKCDMLSDLNRRKPKTIDMNLALSVFKNDEVPLFKNIKLIHLYKSSLYIGHILGEYLYQDYFKKDTHLDIKTDFLASQPTTENFNRIKNKLIQNKDLENDQKRYF